MKTYKGYFVSLPSPIVYVSGAITGLDAVTYNNRFKQGVKEVAWIFDTDPKRVNAVIVINPLDLNDNGDSALSWADFMRRDIMELVKCNSIYMLNNWQDSRGAKIEHQLAIDLDFDNIIYQA